MPRHTLPPTRAGRFVAWGNSFRHGRTSLDDAADRIVGDDAWHRVDGLPSGDDVSLAVALGRLGVAGVRGFRLALPVPGDVSGLPGPLDFNVEALAAGEAVLLDGVDHGLVPTVARSEAMARREGVRWRLLPTDPPRGIGPGSGGGRPGARGRPAVGDADAARPRRGRHGCGDRAGPGRPPGPAVRRRCPRSWLFRPGSRGGASGRVAARGRGAGRRRSRRRGVRHRARGAGASRWRRWRAPLGWRSSLRTTRWTRPAAVSRASPGSVSAPWTRPRRRRC